MGAVVEPDPDELVRHDGVQQLDLVDRVRRAVRLPERVPRQGGGDEALRTGGAGIGDRRIVEPSDPGLAGRVHEPHGLHFSASCYSRRTFIALTARGMPAYGVVWRIVSSISFQGTSMARRALMWARTCGSLEPSE